jgi:cytochrome P450
LPTGLRRVVVAGKAGRGFVSLVQIGVRVMSNGVEYLAEHFNIRDQEFNDPGLIYEVYDKMREKGDLLFSDQPSLMSMVESAQHWVAIGFEACDRILHNWDDFSSNASAIHPEVPENRTVLGLDPALQQQFRKLLNPYFSPRRIEKAEATARKATDELIDGLIEAGEGDLGDVAWRMPGIVLFGEVVGLPVEDVPTCLDLLDVMLHAEDDAKRFEGQMAFSSHLAKLIKTKAGQPRGDSPFDMLMTTTEIDGQPLPVDEIVVNAILIVLAGLETTSNALTSAYYFLGHHTDVRDRLIKDPSLMPAAVEEFVRFEGSVHGLTRVVTKDMEVAGCPLKRGDIIEVNFAAANRDPREFPEPDQFNLDREGNTHLGFGAGPHRCLGSNLARMELRVGLEQVLARMPDYSIDDAKCTFLGNFVTRGYTSLPVAFTPGKRTSVR